MKDYFRCVLKLGVLNEMLTQLFDEAILRACEPVNLYEINNRFRVRNGYIEAAHDNVFRNAPWALIEMFMLMAQHDFIVGVRASTIRLVHELAPADRRRVAARPARQPPVPAAARLAVPRRDPARPHEALRRARPLHPRVRPHRRPDAARPVPRLLGRLAHHPRGAQHAHVPAAARARGFPDRRASRQAPAEARSCSISRGCTTTSPRAAAATTRSWAPRTPSPSAAASG